MTELGLFHGKTRRNSEEVNYSSTTKYHWLTFMIRHPEHPPRFSHHNNHRELVVNRLRHPSYLPGSELPWSTFQHFESVDIKINKYFNYILIECIARNQSGVWEDCCLSFRCEHQRSWADSVHAWNVIYWMNRGHVLMFVYWVDWYS